MILLIFFLIPLLHLEDLFFKYSFKYTMDHFNKPKAEQLQISGKITYNTSQYHGINTTTYLRKNTS